MWVVKRERKHFRKWDRDGRSVECYEEEEENFFSITGLFSRFPFDKSNQIFVWLSKLLYIYILLSLYPYPSRTFVHIFYIIFILNPESEFIHIKKSSENFQLRNTHKNSRLCSRSFPSSRFLWWEFSFFSCVMQKKLYINSIFFMWKTRK